MIDPSSIAGALASVVKMLADVRPLMRRSRGMKRALLLELQLNLQTVQLYLEGAVRAEVAVRALDTRVLKKAIESGFDFGTLKKGTIKPGALAGNSRAYHLAGRTTEQVLRHLYFKIRELQIRRRQPEAPAGGEKAHSAIQHS